MVDLICCNKGVILCRNITYLFRCTEDISPAEKVETSSYAAEEISCRDKHVYVAPKEISSVGTEESLLLQTHAFCYNRSMPSAPGNHMSSLAQEDISFVATEDMSSVATEDIRHALCCNIGHVSFVVTHLLSATGERGDPPQGKLELLPRWGTNPVAAVASGSTF